MPLEMWGLVAISPILAYLICRFGAYGVLCGRRLFYLKYQQKEEHGNS